MYINVKSLKASKALNRNLHKDPIKTIILTAKTIIAEYKDDHFNCNQSSNCDNPTSTKPNQTQLQPRLGLHGSWFDPPPTHPQQTFHEVPARAMKLQENTIQGNVKQKVMSTKK